MCADMLFPWSGRGGFEKLQLLPGEEPMPRATVAAMLSRENELRLSAEIQEKLSRCYDDADASGIHRQKVYREVQEQVAKEFGFSDLEAGMRVLRSVETAFPGDTELSNIS